MNFKGNCESCPKYSYNLSNNQCKSVRCSSYEILETNGKCKMCPLGYFPDSSGLKCKEVKCSPYDIIDTTGKCQMCYKFGFPDIIGK